MNRRPTHAVGERWSKWEAPLMHKPWIEYRAGAIGFWLICMSLGTLLAVLVR